MVVDDFVPIRYGVRIEGVIIALMLTVVGMAEVVELLHVDIDDAGF